MESYHVSQMTRSTWQELMLYDTFHTGGGGRGVDIGVIGTALGLEAWVPGFNSG